MVQNAKYSEVTQDVSPVYVIPFRQDTTLGAITFYVRSALPTAQLLRMIPATMKKLDPNIPGEDLKTMRQQVRDNTALDRLISVLSAAFAALATVLAAADAGAALRMRRADVRRQMSDVSDGTSATVDLLVVRGVR
ncbi:MAG: hypothetical protein M3081_21925 [Gemmatimonadota bacterium]|nr:hypothetical protein [Gemmatimonadota bacterium]